MKTIAIAGATGFVGTGIVNELLDTGYDVLALVRNKTDRHPDHPNYRELECDIFDPQTYEHALEECGTVLNAVGIIEEKPSKGVTFEKIHVELNRTLLETAKESGVKRFILISALGVREDGVSKYQTSKYRAEQDIRESGLGWAVFRPSFVLGPGSGFVEQITPVVKAPLVPVFGDGEYEFQPVHRDVLASAVSALLKADENKWNAVYEMRSKEKHTYKEILQAIARQEGKDDVKFVHVPVWMAKTGVAMFSWLPFFPISMDQLKMLIEGSTGSGRNAVDEFDLEWYGLEEALKRT